jgi:CBS domain-containing protein
MIRIVRPRNPRSVGDLMTRKIYTIGPDDTLDKLEAQMIRFRFRHLPVVHDAKLVGLVSQRDLLKSAAQSAALDEVAVHRIMQTDVATVRQDESLIEAAHLMWEGKIDCLPVIDDDGTLVGIVTEADFVRLAAQLLAAEIDEG